MQLAVAAVQAERAFALNRFFVGQLEQRVFCQGPAEFPVEVRA
jgi:hypothetical protein